LGMGCSIRPIIFVDSPKVHPPVDLRKDVRWTTAGRPRRYRSGMSKDQLPSPPWTFSRDEKAEISQLASVAATRLPLVVLIESAFALGLAVESLPDRNRCFAYAVMREAAVSKFESDQMIENFHKRQGGS